MSYDVDNIFAKIIRGDAPAIRVYEDAKTLAFMDIMPQADGHVLVVPKEAAETLMDLSVVGAHACIATTRRIAIAVRWAVAQPDVFISQMNGPFAGQTVRHCHFHVIPRGPQTVYRGHTAVSADPEKLERIASLIRTRIERDSSE